jgi:hypothetical protein
MNPLLRHSGSRTFGYPDPLPFVSRNARIKDRRRSDNLALSQVVEDPFCDDVRGYINRR